MSARLHGGIIGPVTAQTLLVGLSNTVHIIATVVWIGWSVALPILVAPRITQLFGPDAGAPAAVALRRLSPLASLALAALGVTGMYQLVAHPSYVDFLAVTNTWSRLIFVKHLAVLGSAVLIAYLSGGIVPQIRFRLRARALGHDDQGEVATLATRFRRLAWVNLILGGVVLLMTGLATAIPDPIP